jgi:hypothetical protein
VPRIEFDSAGRIQHAYLEELKPDVNLPIHPSSAIDDEIPKRGDLAKGV